MGKALLILLIALNCKIDWIDGNEEEDTDDIDIYDLIHVNHIKDNHIHIHVPGEYEDCFPPEPTSMPIKRIHSRHRRFIAPGASWQIRIGLFASWGEYDFAYNANLNYGMDYLFGGPTAFASRVAASTAAANATKVVFDNTRTQLNALAALQAAAAGKRRKRSQAGGNPLLAALSKKRKRSTGEEFDEEDYEKDISNILTRTLADDQLEILKKVEDGLDRGGLPGKQCVLRAICEIKETPIHEWSLVGEMITNFILPKKDNLTALDDYRRAETIGEEHGDCWSFYPACPFSIFNIIPDIYTKDDQVEVTFDDFSAGSGTSKEGPDSESDNEDNVNNKNKDADDIFENNSDETLKTLLKQFGGTSDDIKNINIDLDLTKP